MIRFGSRGERRSLSKDRKLQARRQRAVADVLEPRLLLSAVKGHKPHPTPSTPVVTQPASISLSTTSWTPLGPAPISNGPIAGGGAVTGRVNAVASDPSNANVIYVGAAGGGVWKTTDGGTNWTALTDSQMTLATGALAISPGNSSIVYAGTGDPTSSSLSLYGRGVLKSTDGGASWTLLGNSVFDRRDITRIVVDPTNTNTVYVAVTGGGNNGQSSSTGIWKSVDGGTTWSNTTSSINTSDRWADLTMDPVNPQHLIATLCSSGVKAGLYATTNGGTSWTLINSGTPVASFQTNSRVAFSASNGQIVYASFAGLDGNSMGVWKSIDGGATWNKLSNVPEYLGGAGVYDDSLAVDPSNADIVYVGGNSKLLQSRDGGVTWNDITTGAGATSGTGIRHQFEAFDASGRLLDANANGIFRLDNATPGAIAWSDLNGNLSISEFISAALDPTNPDKLFASGPDDGFAMFSGSTTWSQPDAGVDGGTVLVDPQNPSRVYRQVPYASTTAGNFIRRSDDGGVTWTPITNGISQLDPQNTFGPLAIDPNNGNHLLYGTSKVYETFDGGNTWAPISQPFTNGWTSGVAFTVGPLAIAPSNPQTIYASSVNAPVFVTNSDGAAWTANNVPGIGTLLQLVVDSQNPSIVYAVRSSFGTQSVMRSSNGGATWANLTGNLTNNPVNAIVTVGTTLYAGTDNGVYTSLDDGQTWTRFGTALPNVSVHDLEFDPAHQILAAATMGRGVWEISTAPVAPVVVNTLTDDTTPGNGLLSLREAIAAVGGSGQPISFDPSLSGGTITLSAANGPLVIGNSVSVSAPGTGQIIVSTSTASLIEVSGGITARLSGLTITGSGTVLQVDATAKATFLNGSIGTANVTDNGTLTFDQWIDGTTSASISGSGAVVKNGPYTLTLSGTNSYTGATTVWAGTLKGNVSAVRGSITDNIGALVVLDQSSNPGPVTFTGRISGGGAVRLSGSSAVVNLAPFGGGTFFVGTVTIDPGVTLVAGSANSLGGNAIYFVNGNLDLGGFNQSIQGLDGAATGAVFNRSTQTNLTATLAISQNAPSIYSGVLEDVPPGSGATGVLALSNGLNSMTLNGAAANTYTGGTTISANASIQGNSQTIDGVYSDLGSLTIDQSLGTIGDGTTKLNLTGNGKLIVQSGTVRLAAGSSLANTGITTVAGTLVGPSSLGTNAFSASSAYVVTGTLDLGGSDQAIGQLTGTGSITNSHAGLATLTTTIDTTASFTGTITDHPASGGGTVGFRKAGAGALTLQGANTYSGGTTILGGTLSVGPSEGNPLGTGGLFLTGTQTNPLTLNLQGRMTSPVQQTVAVTGFNQDVVAEAGATDAMSSTTAPYDLAGSSGINNVWYEAGFGGALAQGTGLPASGSVITSMANPSVSFQLPSYSGNNVGLITQASPTVTLQLTNPSSFQSLNFLGSGAVGNAILAATLNFADGSTSVMTFTLNDWFNGPNPAVIAGGRVFRTAGTSVTLAGSNPRLYEADLRLAPADEVKVINSITFRLTSGNSAGIFAVSGTAWSLLGSQTYANSVQVAEGTNINISASLSAALGALTVNNGGAAIAISGPSNGQAVMNFGAVTLQSNASFAPGAGVTETLGAVSDGGGGFGVSSVGPGTLELTGGDTYGGSTSVAGGTLLADSATSLPSQTDLTVSGGVVRLRSGTPFTAEIHSVTLAQGVQLDIGNNTLWVHFATPASNDLSLLQTYLANGYDGGNWDGTGSGGNGAIVTSSGESNVARTTGIGYALVSSDQPGGAPANTVILTYDLYGDTNLDHKVDSNDAITLARNYLTSASTWDAGNFNYDSVINYADALLLQKNFGATIAASVVSASIPTSTVTTSTGGTTSPVSSTPQTPISTTTTTTVQDPSDATQKKKESHPLHAKKRR